MDQWDRLELGTMHRTNAGTSFVLGTYRIVTLLVQDQQILGERCMGTIERSVSWAWEACVRVIATAVIVARRPPGLPGRYLFVVARRRRECA